MIARFAMVMAAGALAASAPAWAADPPVPPPPGPADKIDGRGGCVFINQLQGNHPLGDRSVIFRANVKDFYRMDFAQQCPELTYPDPVLIMTPVGGIGAICRAIDVDVKVREQGPGGFPVPCIPSAFYKLTPAEAAAIPRKDIP